MGNLILHIGRHKTGTTSLQKFLASNNDHLLGLGFYYPLLFSEDFAHHRLARCFFRNEKEKLDEDSLMNVRDDIMKHKTTIISSEAFQNVDPLKLKEYIGDIDVQIIVYLREQIEYLLSAYAQIIQSSSYSGTIRDFQKNVLNYDYLGFIQKWESAFPNSKIIINLFNKEVLYENDIRKDFLLKCGICNIIELNSFEFDNEDRNPSIGGPLVEFKRQLNTTDLLSEISWKTLYSILKKLAQQNKDYILKKNIIPEEIYLSMKRELDEDNKKISSLYLDTTISISDNYSFANPFQLDKEQFKKILNGISLIDKKAAKIIKKYSYSLYRCE